MEIWTIKKQEHENNTQTQANKVTAAMKLCRAGFRRRKVPREREISQLIKSSIVQLLMEIRDPSASKHRALTQMKRYWSTSIYNYPQQFPLPSLSGRSQGLETEQKLKGKKLSKDSLNATPKACCIKDYNKTSNWTSKKIKQFNAYESHC